MQQSDKPGGGRRRQDQQLCLLQTPVRRLVGRSLSEQRTRLATPELGGCLTDIAGATGNATWSCGLLRRICLMW